MFNKNALIAASAMAAAMCCAAPTMACEQGDWIIRAGAANVDPDTDSDKIDIAGLATLDYRHLHADRQLGY